MIFVCFVGYGCELIEEKTPQLKKSCGDHFK